jgi:glutamate synthase (NADPH) small chain
VQRSVARALQAIPFCIPFCIAGRANFWDKERVKRRTMSENSLHKANPKYAWLEVARKGLPKRSGAERVADFLEICGSYDEATAREQASRCVQCPNPTCVSGCPLCSPIPEWMQLTAEGRFLEAATVLNSVTAMAEVCARLCPSEQLCERACLLNSAGESVPIRELEHFLLDFARKHGAMDTSTAPPNGKNVAIVGSGPGCLACAEDLARKGYETTVFDAALVPGGLLANGVPGFRLEQSLMQRRVDALRKRGVTFQLGANLWSDVTLDSLLASHDAVYLGFDSRKARPLMVPGAETLGVVQALPFLLQAAESPVLDSPRVEVHGRRVVVLGGGDTAMDCLRTAIRLGAKEAVGVYRRGEDDMPCTRHHYEEALEEGAQFIFCAAPVAILKNDSGRVGGVQLLRTELGTSEDDTPRPFLIQPGTEFDLAADCIVLALGFEPVASRKTAGLQRLSLNPQGGLQVDERQATTVPCVFAGGDIVRGPCSLLDSVRDGRKAAKEMDALLSKARGASAPS